MLHLLSSVSRGANELLVLSLSLLIFLYRYSLAYFLGGRCRFDPSCSAYALSALKQHGAVKGLYLSGKRFCRCHPWGGSGYDPVPSPHTEVGRSNDT